MRLRFALYLCWLSVASSLAMSHHLIHHYSIEDGLSQNTVSCILQDQQGYMWFGTWDGLNRYDGYSFVSFRSDIADNIADHNNRIDYLWEDSGQIYACNYDRLVFTVCDRHLCPTTIDTLPIQSEDSIYVDRHGIIWTVDDQVGISRFRDGKWRRLCPPLDPRYAGQLKRNFLMLEDQEGNLWVNPTGGGFSKYNYEEDCLEWPFPQVTNMIHTAYIDRQGLLWLSTYDHGIDCIDLHTQPFECEDLRTASDPIGEVRAMMVDGDELRTYQRNEQMVYCATKTQRYGVLLGTKGRGVVGLPVQTPSHDVYHILEVADTIFIATYGEGIVQQYDDTYRVIAPRLKVRDLLWADSVLVAATTSGVLVGNQLIPYYDVRCLLRTVDGTIWAGTFGGGLNRLEHDGTSFKLVPEYVPSRIVLAMVEDQDGNIWYTGENDITCVNPYTKAYQHYNVFSGEHGACFNEAKAVALGDELYFGYNHGYCHFQPAVMHQSDFVPPLVINDIEYKNKNAVAISFAALDYASPRKILYSWQLSGVDKDWVTSTSERKANYTNLKPGKYIFTVRSTNSEGVWVNNDAQVTITIQRTFWQTGWAVLLILVVIGLIGWSIWRYFASTNALRQEVEVEQKVTDIKLRFFTNISHELRTPLTLISGPVDNVLTNEKLSPAVREQLEIVSSNARRMLRMINQLLDFRKMQQHQMKLKVRPIHFWNLIEEICGNFTKEAQTKSIDFTKNLLSHDDLVWVDSDKMDMVIYNLLSNAFKYTKAGGAIKVTLDDKEDFLKLSVADTGIGIPKEKRNILFERFKSNNELNGKNIQMGTGIGLNLTKELVDMHHGYIEVESEEGKGSVFTVLIKKGNEHFGTEVDIVVDDSVSAKEMQQTMPHQWAVQESKPKMLVVDDNADMRIFISNIFVDQFMVQTAEDGLDALEKIKSSMPDIILSDWMMPNMDGLELLRRVRESEKTASVPVILLTAKTTIESQLQGLEQGADDYITKPFSPAFIKVKVNNLLLQREKLRAQYHSQLISMDTHKQEKTPDDLFLARLMAFMDQQMDNNALTVEDMVDYMNMGRTVFFNRLKNLTGLSPVEFIREVRIKRSVQLLELNSYNVTEITYMVGMSDSRYFSKCFKQVMGVTPSEYKRQRNETANKA
ncbi:MAG: response regulator [Paludibacteraceae bacterium]|nr:response regulator [Paludibacteraceae bacterium]